VLASSVAVCCCSARAPAAARDGRMPWLAAYCMSSARTLISPTTATENVSEAQFPMQLTNGLSLHVFRVRVVGAVSPKWIYHRRTVVYEKQPYGRTLAQCP
jgi:hypothetical protein